MESTVGTEKENALEHITWSPDFSDPDADIVLVSSDRVGYRMFSLDLKRSSAVFKDMLGMPPTENESGVIHLTETSSQLGPLFQLISAQSLPEDISSIEAILFAAEKYQINGAVKIAHQLLRYNAGALIKTHPLHAYFLACRFGLHDIMQTAATATLDVDICDEYNRPLSKRIPLDDFHRLRDLRLERRDAVDKRLSQVLDSKNPEMWMLQCAHYNPSHRRLTIHESLSRFMEDLQSAVFRELTRRPSGNGLDSASFLSIRILAENQDANWQICTGNHYRSKMDIVKEIRRYLAELPSTVTFSNT